MKICGISRVLPVPFILASLFHTCGHKELTSTPSAGADTVRLPPQTAMSFPGVLTLLSDLCCNRNILSSHDALSRCISQGPRGNRSRHRS
jgi:hypothetical protein